MGEEDGAKEIILRKQNKTNQKTKPPRHGPPKTSSSLEPSIIRAHGLPFINNLSINTATDVILKYVVLKMPTSNWLDLVICTTRDAQFQ